MTIGGCLCALWALGRGSAGLGTMCVEYMYLYWIYFANIFALETFILRNRYIEFN